MYTVGFIDNDPELFDDYQVRLKRKGINLICSNECRSKDDFLIWVLENNIKCLMVDYLLKPDFPFQGTDLVVYFNEMLPDLPCIILTNYEEDSINEKLVVAYLICDRSIMDRDDIEDFTRKIKHAVEVFENKMGRNLSEYSQLLERKRASGLNSSEEERFLHLYKILKSYGEVDDLPNNLLKDEMSDKMNTLLGKLDELIEKTENRG